MTPTKYLHGGVALWRRYKDVRLKKFETNKISAIQNWELTQSMMKAVWKRLLTMKWLPTFAAALAQSILLEKRCPMYPTWRTRSAILGNFHQLETYQAHLRHTNICSWWWDWERMGLNARHSAAKWLLDSRDLWSNLKCWTPELEATWGLWILYIPIETVYRVPRASERGCTFVLF